MALRVSELVGLIQGDRVGEFNSASKMLNLRLKDIQTSDLIVELQLRGLDVSSIIEQLQSERVPKEAKVIPFPLRA